MEFKPNKLFQKCVQPYNQGIFPVLRKDNSEFHLVVLEFAYIKSYQPSLIKQEWLVGK